MPSSRVERQRSSRTGTHPVLPSVGDVVLIGKNANWQCQRQIMVRVLSSYREPMHADLGWIHGEMLTNQGDTAGLIHLPVRISGLVVGRALEDAATLLDDMGSAPAARRAALLMSLRWTGREATALRHARRMSIRAYAAYLGLVSTTVAQWDVRGGQLRLRPETQQLLDIDLARASTDIQQRFATALIATAEAIAREPDGRSRTR